MRLSFFNNNNPWVVIGKLNLVLMVVFTSLIGYALAATEIIVFDVFFLACGIFLSASAAHIFNQFLERKSDAIMERTKHRPLPTQRIKPQTALMVATICLLCGLVFLLAVDKISAMLSSATVFLYVLVYTPLKKISLINTWVGALPGALPIFIGFYATNSNQQTPDFTIWATFWILYFWQIPHFLSLAWKYKEDYKLADLKMLVVVDKRGVWTAWVILLHGLILLAIVVYTYIYSKNLLVFCLSLVLSLYFLYLMVGFIVGKKNKYAKKIFLFSLFYLPFILLFFTIPKILHSLLTI